MPLSYLFKTFILITSFILLSGCSTKSTDTTEKQVELPSPSEEALATISSFVENNGTSTTPPSIADYTTVGVVGVDTTNIDEINALILTLTPTDVDTKEEIQAILDALNIELKAIVIISALANGSTIVSIITDYENAGVTGVTSENIDEINQLISSKKPFEVDTKEKIQSLVDSLTTNPNPETNSTTTIDENGTTTVTDSTGKVTITDTMGTITVKDINGTTTVTDSIGKVTITDTTGTITVKDINGTTTVTDSIGKVIITDTIGTITVKDINGTTTVTDSTGKVTITDTTGTITVKDVNGTTTVIDTNGTTTVTDENGTTTVVDKTSPVITLNGDENITVEYKGSYIEYSATANDIYDGNITSRISIIGGDFNTSVLGSYTVTYTITDSNHNTATAIRTVTIQDKTPPVITLNGEANITLEYNAVYEERNATANDMYDGNISANIIITGGVNTSVLGSYTVTYTITDSNHNTATAIRTVTIQDKTSPVITLNGDENITVEYKGSYIEYSATANDIYDGNITSRISIIGGDFNTSVLGEHNITYSVRDENNNTATAIRTVTIQDKTPPVITLNGDTNITLEYNAVYEERNATANDMYDGNISANIIITGGVNTSVLGSYTVTYTITDSNHNTATAIRTVTIQDKTPPVITLNGEANITLEYKGSYIEYSATANDIYDGNITSRISIIGGDFNTSVLGEHNITYSVRDENNNTATAIRTVTIQDKTPPVITLNGEANITLEYNAVYEERNATANDMYDGNISANIIITGGVNTSVLGSYTVTYTITDSNNNTATAIRTVTIQDKTPPVITLNGEANITLEYKGSYIEYSATANDMYDGNISANIIITGGVNTSVLGLYTVTYTITDSNHNTATAIRTVTIQDKTPPVITLNGEANITLEYNAVYEERNATANDMYDGNISANIIITGGVNTSVLGSYTVTYTITDSNNNTATAIRTVTIQDKTPPVITLNGEANITLEYKGSYIEYSATANDMHDGNISANIIITGGVNTSVLGLYTVTYTITDSNHNTATAIRTVTIQDKTPPVITLNGEANITLEYNAVYEERNATANDMYDGNISANIIITGGVNTSVLGSYTVTYTITDSNNNTAVVTRTVTVVDTTPPVITLINSDVNTTHEYNTEYFDANATATDNYDGNMDANITTIGDDFNTSKFGEHTITYTVTDENNNTAIATRIVTVVDTTPPEITLNGDATIYLVQGDTYIEYNATATDNYDGNMDANITITGEVNNTEIGSYTVSYNVTDSHSNDAVEVNRTVNVAENQAPIANAGGNQTVTEGDRIILDGSTSSDIDGNISNYEWKTEDGTVVYSGDLNETTLPTVFPLEIGTHTLTLTVTDNHDLNNTNESNITVIVKIGESNLRKSGQTASFAQYDDGYYLAGKDTNYSKDVEGNVTDHLTGLKWEDNVNFFINPTPNTDTPWDWNTIMGVNAGGVDDVDNTGRNICNHIFDFPDNSSGWRLPTRQEFLDLVDYGDSAPAINTTLFPNFPTGSALWTSTKDKSNTQNAFGIGFNNGITVSIDKTDGNQLIRCVNANNSSPIDANFTSTGNGTVIDNNTMLEWEDNGTATEGNWTEALTYCHDLNLSDVEGIVWRLPNMRELASLVDDNQSNPAIDGNFTHTANADYWSATTDNNSNLTVWTVSFVNGVTTNIANQDDTAKIRCVRTRREASFYP